MRHHPSTIHGYYAAGIHVCADCYRTVAESFKLQALPIREYDRDKGRECALCGDTVAGPMRDCDAPDNAPGLEEAPDLSIGDDE